MAEPAPREARGRWRPLAAAAPPRPSAPAAPCAAARRRAGLPAACLPACRRPRTVSVPAAPDGTPPLRGRLEEVVRGPRRDGGGCAGGGGAKRKVGRPWPVAAVPRAGFSVAAPALVPWETEGCLCPPRARPAAPTGGPVGPVAFGKQRRLQPRVVELPGCPQKSGSGFGVRRYCLRQGSSFSEKNCFLFRRKVVWGLCPARLCISLRLAGVKMQESG